MKNFVTKEPLSAKCVAAGTADIEGLIRLRKLLLSDGDAHYSATSPEEDLAWQLHYQKWLIQKLNEPAGNVKVVVVHDEADNVIACATGILDERAPMPGILNGVQGWIQSVVVAPEWRGNGLASLLLTALFSWFSSRDAGKVMLQTTLAGDALYRKLGFKNSGEDLLIKTL
ncbi:GNAT family N-acetyltransferase [Salmonella enterica subsp. enterica serovar Oranienburg]|nr:GNAT family N-acetyltransferase [Salmonella enterica subsp. enterica serovar Oranienburg]EEP1424122.1 GNAT family N-acetyltransferase [Salmonella enterica]EIG8968262.1 GNAT family N-acetyltransferase [Salmonella enterica]EJE9730155.1 GNAT family N-acetyltransferase [Salmonella enterica]